MISAFQTEVPPTSRFLGDFGACQFLEHYFATHDAGVLLSHSIGYQGALKS